jgi:hypothetical protein
VVTYGKFFSFFAILPLCVFVLTSFNVSAQKNSDIGLFAGTSYYMGDLNSAVHYAAPSFAVGPIYRYNFNERNSIRGHAFYHGLSGSDPDYSGYISAGQRTDFATKFVDLGLDFEFNWKPYKTAYRKTKSSPYVFVGLGYGLMVVPAPNVKSHFTMPFGLGYKINVGRWLSAGAELSSRKTFSDLVDGVSNPPLDAAITFFGNRDWYFFTGVFVTYKIFKFWDECPAYDN